ncbi:hypothetical protein [Deinococcus maricopensis]|uniref:hypothetical protein n=1 Tax=Deinococcus maricopensis TaxID=309887 RepID=UPI0005C20B27|nr:hypothetical protein [Deinococcus maricopensis]
MPRALAVITALLWLAGFAAPEALRAVLLILPLPALAVLATLDSTPGSAALRVTGGAARTLTWRGPVGFALLAAPASSAVLRDLLSGQVGSAAALLGAYAFMAALALTLGALGTAPVTIEGPALLLWYVGPLSGLPALNYASAALLPFTLVITVALAGVLGFVHGRAARAPLPWGRA